MASPSYTQAAKGLVTEVDTKHRVGSLSSSCCELSYELATANVADLSVNRAGRMALIYNEKQEGTPGTHVFIVGVGTYPHFPGHTAETPEGQIDSAANGALEIAGWFMKRFENPDAPLQTVRLLLSGEDQAAQAAERYKIGIEPATFLNVKAEYVAWMNDLASTEDNVAVFYFAGHGFGTEEMQCLLLEDYNQDPDSPTDGALNYNNLVQSVRVNRKLNHGWFFVDACRQANLEDVARNEWGRKLNTKMTPLGGPTSCLQLFSAAPGEEALGEEGKVTFFAAALAEALEKNGYARGAHGGWVVQIGTLQTAVAINLKRTCSDAGVPEDEIPRVTANIPDPFPVLHHRPLDNPPEFLVKVTCVPERDNLRYTLTCTSMSTEEVTSRPPDEEPWFANLQPGAYRFEACDGKGVASMQRTEHIYLSYLEIQLKGAV